MNIKRVGKLKKFNNTVSLLNDYAYGQWRFAWLRFYHPIQTLPEDNALGKH